MTRPSIRVLGALAGTALIASALYRAWPAGTLSFTDRTGPLDAARSAAVARPLPTATPTWWGSVAAVAVRDGAGQAVALAEVGGGASHGNGGEGRSLRRLVTGFDAIAGLSWSPDGGALAFGGLREANWDIYRVDRDGSGLARLTDDPAFDAWPAWSPDGRTMAFVSYRDGNLDIYTQPLAEAAPEPVSSGSAAPAPALGSAGAGSTAGSTAGSAADGSPAGGSTTASVSVAPPITPAARLTTSDGPAVDPAWSPDGRWLAFAAWHEGAYRLEAVDVADGSRRVVDEDADGTDLRAPAWSPDGSQLAYVARRHGQGQLALQDWAVEVAMLGPEDESGGASDGDVDGDRGGGIDGGIDGGGDGDGGGDSDGDRDGDVDGGDAPPATGFSTTLALRVDGFGWHPDGGALAWVAAERGGRRLEVAEGAGSIGRPVADLPADASQVSWARGPLPAGLPALNDASIAPPASADPNDRPGLAVLGDVAVSGPRIHAGLEADFAALRADVRAATGRDFLGTLSDLWRPLSFYSSASAFFSWHKLGRAFDTQMEMRGPGGRRDLVLVREDVGGRTMWRMFLRAAAQDGSVGRPLTEPGWTFSAGGGDETHEREGGLRAGSVPAGYWVDFTALAARYGWQRIPSLTQSRLDWRRDWAAIEYWHYERREGLSWFEAARQVYDDDHLSTTLHPDRLSDLGVAQGRRGRLGFPAQWPPSDG